jgi:hypothetical protein
MTKRSTTPPPSTRQLGIRVPARISDRLEALAASENNRISSVVRRLLTSALKQAGDTRTGGEAA